MPVQALLPIVICIPARKPTQDPLLDDGKLLLRVPAQVYVDEADITRLAAVLDRHGWPGR